MDTVTVDEQAQQVIVVLELVPQPSGGPQEAPSATEDAVAVARLVCPLPVVTARQAPVAAHASGQQWMSPTTVPGCSHQLEIVLSSAGSARVEALAAGRELLELLKELRSDALHDWTAQYETRQRFSNWPVELWSSPRG